MSGGGVLLNSPSRFQIRIVGPEGERVERLHKTELVIGRSAQADIIVANAEVSRRHVTMRIDGDQLLIVDEGSKNGTFLDGVRIPASLPRVWRFGQSLKLGLAPEKLTLEPAVEQKDAPDAPPPVETMVTRASAAARRVGNVVAAAKPEPIAPPKDVELSDPSIKQVVEEKNVSAAKTGVTNLRNVGAVTNVTNVMSNLSRTNLTATEPLMSDALKNTGTYNRTAVTARLTANELGRSFTNRTMKVEETPEDQEAIVAKGTSKLKVEPAPAAKVETPVERKSEVRSETRSGTNISDLERRMQEVLARAEAEAQSLRLAAEKESRSIQASLENERRQVAEDAQAVQLEKAKLESQLRELREEIKTRSQERKTLARDHAEAKLNLQNSQSEVRRLELAKTQLSAELSDEIVALEKKIDKLEAEASTVNEVQKQKAIKESRDIVEVAKKQAEMLMSEAEVKVKTQREKMQAKISDERRTAELDLADLKLKQVAEIKAAQERLEADLQKKQQKTVNVFLSEVREKCESNVFGSSLDSNVKVRLLTSIEESLHRHFVGATESRNTTGKMAMTGKGKISPATESSEEPTMVRGVSTASVNFNNAQTNPSIQITAIEDDDGEEEPPPVPKFPLRLQILSAVCLVAVIVAGFWLRGKPEGESQLASSAKAPAVIPQTAAAVVAPATPPPAPVVVAPPNVVATSAPAGVVAAPVDAAPTAAVPPPVIPPTETVPASWSEVVLLKPVGTWQTSAQNYLDSLSVDRRKARRYQMLEQRFTREVAKFPGRSPASLKEQQRLESEFTREAFQLLGPATWAKLMTYRDYFWNKNR